MLDKKRRKMNVMMAERACGSGNREAAGNVRSLLGSAEIGHECRINLEPSGRARSYLLRFHTGNLSGEWISFILFLLISESCSQRIIIWKLLFLTESRTRRSGNLSKMMAFTSCPDKL